MYRSLYFDLFFYGNFWLGCDILSKIVVLIFMFFDISAPLEEAICCVGKVAKFKYKQCPVVTYDIEDCFAYNNTIPRNPLLSIPKP